MAENSSVFQEQDFSKGMNEDVPEGAIPDGFVEVLENGYPTGATVVKRKGYELKGGTLPLRVTSASVVDRGGNTATMYLTVAGDVDLSVIRNKPVILFGTTSKSLLPDYFDTLLPTGVYAYSPTIDPRRSVAAGDTEIFTFTPDETALTHSDVLVGVAESTSLINSTNVQTFVEGITADPSSFSISVSIDNSGGGSSKDFYTYYLDAGPDSSYYRYIHTQASPSATWSFNPSLPYNNLIARCYNSSGVMITPDSLSLDPLTGIVTIGFSSSQTGKCVCITAESDHMTSGYQINNFLQSGGATTITLPAGTADQPWGFVEVYTVHPTLGTYDLCFPDSVTVTSTGSVIIQFDNQTLSQDTVRIHWAFTGIISRIAIDFDPSGSVTEGTDTSPQLCIYGISQVDAFTGLGAKERSGWVSSVDHYKTAEESLLVATSGWNLFALRGPLSAATAAGYTISDGEDDTARPYMLMPSHYPFLRQRTSSATAYDPTLAPAFVTSDPGVGRRRSRGLWASSSVDSSGYVTATSISYSAGLVNLSIPLTSLSTVAGNGPTPSIVIADDYDYVTIEQGPYSWLQGDFVIKGHTVASNLITLKISVPRYNSSKYDLASCRVKLGIFTDALEFASPVPFIPGDVLKSSLLPNDQATVKSVGLRTSSRCTIYLGGITSRTILSHNLEMVARRPSARIIGVRTNDNGHWSHETLRVVAGDVLTFSSTSSRRTVAESWAHQEDTVAVTAGVNGATVELSSGYFDTADLSIGQRLLFIESGEYSGVQVVKSITDIGVFTIETAGTSNATCRIQGPSITLDATIDVEDYVNNSSRLTVGERWFCVEPPTGTNFAGAVIQVNPSTNKQFSGKFGLQPLVRTTMVNDTMFLTNGVDPVWKFDGKNWMNAGLPRWMGFLHFSGPPGLAAGVPASPTLYGGSFTASIAVASVTDSSGNIFYPPAYSGEKLYFPEGAASTLSPGDYIFPNGDIGALLSTLPVRVREVKTEETEWQSQTVPKTGSYRARMDVVTVDAYVGGTTYSITPAAFYGAGSIFNYYCRFQYIDRNKNQVSSAVIGSQDMRFCLREQSRQTPGFKYLSFPKYGIYPYSAMEVEVYRSRYKGTDYYRVANVPLAREAVAASGAPQGTHYAHLFDMVNEAVLAISDADKDPVATRIGGEELPTGVYPPPIAKYITSIDGRLALAYTTSVPKISLRFKQGNLLTAQSGTFADAVFTLRRDKNDTGTTTDYVNRVSFVFTTGLIDNARTTAIFEAVVGDTYDTLVTVPVGDSTKYHVGDWIYVVQNSRLTGMRICGYHLVAELDRGGANRISFRTNVPANSTAYNTTDPDSIFSIYASSGYASSTSVPVVTSNTDTNRNILLSDTVRTSQNFISIYGERFATAVNAVAALVPEASWFMAEGGGDFAAGTVNFLFPKALSTTPELQLPASWDENRVKIYGNGVVSPQNSAIPALQYTRGSRVSVSYPARPEMFDNPGAEDVSQSSYNWDVNPADGQDITCIIPLLGTSTSSGSQLESILLIFKERSVYALNVNGGSPQLLETNGMGCESPYSVSHIQNGLAFANRAGIFMIDRDLKVSKIGRNIARSFLNYGKTSLPLLQGHHRGSLQQYKLAMGADKVLVANYSTMGQGGDPAWTVDTAHEVRGGWCNYGALEVFASGKNRVFIERSAGTAEDYRDNTAGIPFKLEFRMTAFGDSTIRKQVRHVGVTYRNQDSATTARTYVAVNAKKTFVEMDQSAVDIDTDRKVQTLRYSVPNGRFNYIQLRVISGDLDDKVEIGGVQYRVIGLTSWGTQEAKSTAPTS